METSSAPVLIEAESISKRYPIRPVTIFPPVRSIFERDYALFRGRRDPEDETAETPRTFAAGEYDLGIDAVADDDDDDDDDLDDEAGVGPPPPVAGADETFWALRDVSLQVRAGAAVGIAGGPGAGKSTLLRILAGRALPTTGRVSVRGQLAPLAVDVQRALGLTAKASGHDVVLASRLVGVDARVSRRHREEIEELARPLLDPYGDPARGAALRLGVAASVVLPGDVTLLDDMRGLDDEFVARIVERLRRGLDSGRALVLATRDVTFARELCGELISLAGEDDPAAEPDAPEESAPRRVRAVPFNASAALLTSEVQTATGARSKRFGTHEELFVEIRVETASPYTSVRCGVCFMPRNGPAGFRLEQPEPLEVVRPGTHVLVARLRPGSLPSAAFDVRADATVVAPGESPAPVIARGAGRLRIDGDALDFAQPSAPPEACWDGSSVWPVEADWLIREEPRGR